MKEEKRGTRGKEAGKDEEAGRERKDETKG